MLALFPSAADRDLCAEALDVASKHPQCGVPACLRYSGTQATQIEDGTPITGPVCTDPRQCPYATLHLTSRWDRPAGVAREAPRPAWAVVLTDEVRSYQDLTVDVDGAPYTFPETWTEHDPAEGEAWEEAPEPEEPEPESAPEPEEPPPEPARDPRRGLASWVRGRGNKDPKDRKDPKGRGE